ncbi:IS110 family transposase [Mucilaginibacter rubeus]|nr:transposase [Mucilaginibacter rubeus]
MIICFEHTGMYSIKLATYLNDIGIPFAMLPALQIKQSIGIRRGKNDQIDAQRIAEYAWLHRETIQATLLPAKSILKLQSLLTLRNRLVCDRGGMKPHGKNRKRHWKEKSTRDISSL